MSRYARERLLHFRERYAPARSEVARRVERLALGQDEGVNGYTTVAEARRLSALLGLRPEALLLDLGSGRGWPGSWLAAEAGCGVVLADLPAGALRQGRAFTEARGGVRWSAAVCADGTSLPFRPGVFDAVVHADVLC